MPPSVSICARISSGDRDRAKIGAVITGLNRKGEGAIVLAERLIEKLSSAVVATTDDADAAG